MLLTLMVLRFTRLDELLVCVVLSHREICHYHNGFMTLSITDVTLSQIIILLWFCTDSLVCKTNLIAVFLKEDILCDFNLVILKFL